MRAAPIQFDAPQDTIKELFSYINGLVVCSGYLCPLSHANRLSRNVFACSLWVGRQTSLTSPRSISSQQSYSMISCCMLMMMETSFHCGVPVWALSYWVSIACVAFCSGMHVWVRMSDTCILYVHMCLCVSHLVPLPQLSSQARILL